MAAATSDKQDHQSRPHHVVVVGSGILGLSAAYYVKKFAEESNKNLKLTIIDRGPGPCASGASRFNGGMLAHALANSWAQPPLLKTGFWIILGELQQGMKESLESFGVVSATSRKTVVEAQEHVHTATTAISQSVMRPMRGALDSAKNSFRSVSSSIYGFGSNDAPAAREDGDAANKSSGVKRGKLGVELNCLLDPSFYTFGIHFAKHALLFGKENDRRLCEIVKLSKNLLGDLEQELKFENNDFTKGYLKIDKEKDLFRGSMIVNTNPDRSTLIPKLETLRNEHGYNVEILEGKGKILEEINHGLSQARKKSAQVVNIDGLKTNDAVWYKDDGQGDSRMFGEEMEKCLMGKSKPNCDKNTSVEIKYNVQVDSVNYNCNPVTRVYETAKNIVGKYTTGAEESSTVKIDSVKLSTGEILEADSFIFAQGIEMGTFLRKERLGKVPMCGALGYLADVDCNFTRTNPKKSDAVGLKHGIYDPDAGFAVPLADPSPEFQYDQRLRLASGVVLMRPDKAPENYRSYVGYEGKNKNLEKHNKEFGVMIRKLCGTGDEQVPTTAEDQQQQQAAPVLNVSSYRVAEKRTCIRPLVADDVPVMGKLRNVANGYACGGGGSKGWCLSPAVGCIMGSILMDDLERVSTVNTKSSNTWRAKITDRIPNLNIDWFSPNRFYWV